MEACCQLGIPYTQRSWDSNSAFQPHIFPTVSCWGFGLTLVLPEADLRQRCKYNLFTWKVNETPVVKCGKKREEKEANERRVNKLVTAMGHQGAISLGALGTVVVSPAGWGRWGIYTSNPISQRLGCSLTVLIFHSPVFYVGGQWGFCWSEKVEGKEMEADLIEILWLV